MTRAKVEAGYLLIQRSSQGWVVAQCPWSVGERECGEHCPHFGEPNRFADTVTLTICQMTKFVVEEE